MSDYDLVVWDFDGVLNANLVEGRPLWAERVARDLDIDADSFAQFVFASGRFAESLCDRLDLREIVGAWLQKEAQTLTADTVLSYWFTRDARPDPEVIGWLEAHPGRRVIGTNNERYRARYIENEMGFADRVERVFSSGKLGVAKPDSAFFEAIAIWAGVAHERILLIDDSLENVEAAMRQGWQGFHFSDETRAGLPARLGIA